MAKISIWDNGTQESKEIRKVLEEKLKLASLTVSSVFSGDEELIVCIGGDGSLLSMLTKYKYPAIPISGINTGHLGFFQELDKTDIDEFIHKYKNGDYTIQQYRTVCCEILYETNDVASEKANIKPRRDSFQGLNEIIIKGAFSHAAHLNISIDENFIERFSGDGIAISTAAGSTAINYSLGGAIVDPRIDLLQITPIAPINSAAYRSFTSSVILPPNLDISIFPEHINSKALVLVVDGVEHIIKEAVDIKLHLSKERINIMRFLDYEFWKTVKQKLL
jgi:NAD+ kinase